MYKIILKSSVWQSGIKYAVQKQFGVQKSQKCKTDVLDPP